MNVTGNINELDSPVCATTTFLNDIFTSHSVDFLDRARGETERERQTDRQTDREQDVSETIGKRK